MAKWTNNWGVFVEYNGLDRTEARSENCLINTKFIEAGILNLDYEEVIPVYVEPTQPVQY
jgi:hypothetical protein